MKDVQNGSTSTDTVSTDMPCHVMPLCCILFALYLLFLPPSSPVDPAAAADYTAAEYDYVVDDRTATVERPGKKSHFPSPDIAYLFRTFLALGIATATATLQSYSIA